MTLTEQVKNLQLDDKVSIHTKSGMIYTGMVGETSDQNVLVLHQEEGRFLLDLNHLQMTALKIYQDK